MAARDKDNIGLMLTQAGAKIEIARVVNQHGIASLIRIRNSMSMAFMVLFAIIICSTGTLIPASFIFICSVFLNGRYPRGLPYSENFSCGLRIIWRSALRKNSVSSHSSGKTASGTKNIATFAKACFSLECRSGLTNERGLSASISVVCRAWLTKYPLPE